MRNDIGSSRSTAQLSSRQTYVVHLQLNETTAKRDDHAPTVRAFTWKLGHPNGKQFCATHSCQQIKKTEMF